ncbi:MAG: hypothetical protein K2O85_01730 [Helicobacter sp.]|nr:hypothetical protein [Helicobacter sp.]
MKKHVFFAIFVALLVSACDYQRRVTAAEIGCRKENIVFVDEGGWLFPNYWVVRCGEREYVCSNGTSSAAIIPVSNSGVVVGGGKSGVTCSQIVD